jgi:hypothetical protein
MPPLSPVVPGDQMLSLLTVIDDALKRWGRIRHHGLKWYLISLRALKVWIENKRLKD